MTRVAARAIVHLDRNAPSVEGLVCRRRGRMVIAGHYVLRDAKVLHSADGSMEVSSTSVAGEMHIPEGRVLYVELLG